jgi:glucan biosynthesis protein C
LAIQESTVSGRLHYIDWLRVLAFSVLIVYHCSVAFFPDMSWLVRSEQTSQLLSWVMDFPRAWRLALLFFVSGMGTWFAFRSMPNLIFLRDRTIRLLVPLIFAMCVIVVPQVWYERMIEDGYTGSLLTFWTERYFTEGKYPTGNFTWAHMWFVAYLLVMTIVCYPIFRFIVDPRARRISSGFEQIARGSGIYLLFLLPLALNLILTPLFPRQTNALYNDGAWFAVWACWFGFGFLFARHHREVIDAVVQRRWLSASLALVLTAFLYRYAWLVETSNLRIGGYDDQTPLFKAALFALAWTMILALIGFAAVHLNRRSGVVSWLNRKVFPLYIVHQTIIVAALFHILPLHLPLAVKVGLVVALTWMGSLLFAMACERLPDFLKVAVGLPPAAARSDGRERIGMRA